MIRNTGQRTDIPAFYPKWLTNRIKEGRPDDKINEVIQRSWVNGQMDIFDNLK